MTRNKLTVFIGSTLVSLCTLTAAHAQLSPVKETAAAPAAPEEQLVKADPKAGFKDLFEKAELKTATFKGIKTEHLNPKAISFVKDYIDRNARELNELKTWARPYFDMMDDVLSQNGIPKELKYLAVIESHLRANLVSWAGAVGPWQFMPGTARGLGLNVSRGRDERTDYLKSTRAASKYLNYLFNIYNDWLLVVAAYNCGPGRVNSAINKAGSNDFWDLQYYLPAESRNHVKKFIATHYIMEGQGGVTTVSREQALAMMKTVKDESTQQNVKVQTISGRFNSKAIAKYLDMSVTDFNKLNPSLDKVLASNSTYQLKLPEEKVDLFLEKKNEMLNESIQMLINPEYRN
ncbi:lytic transglycosylase domain-containing protein [Niabella beijingensis]|uniref:lytic transglycosylase domain-containing protein n=1 Tax=Niabella beijingensis TaxID=2872700 RepID=UPI001CBD80C6|nr:lytic transglycosylase domain-containing protein [Niabella beijingensis]MBZ4190852.1 transglycosylase SLT domain-containing protein [Niabella beijingensis]